MPRKKWTKHYSNLSVLKKIAPTLIVDLIKRYPDYFNDYQITPIIPLDYEQLKSAFMDTKNQTMPKELLNILYASTEMATEDYVDNLLETLRRQKRTIPNTYKTPLDIALYCCLYEMEIFNRCYLLSYITQKRSFHYFFPKKDSKIVRALDKTMAKEIEQSLRTWCIANNRSSHVRCDIYQKESIIWLAISYGASMKRENSIDEEGQQKILFYHPEKTDLIIYDVKHQRLQMQFHSKTLMNICLYFLGKFLYGDRRCCINSCE